jgi:putative transposase
LLPSVSFLVRLNVSNRMFPSVSRISGFGANAVADTLFGSLKVGWLRGMRFDTRWMAKQEVMDWLQFYDCRRLIRRQAISAQ